MTALAWLERLKRREPDVLKRRVAIVARLRRKAMALSPAQAEAALLTFGGPSGPGSNSMQREWVGMWSQSLDQRLRAYLGVSMRRASR